MGWNKLTIAATVCALSLTSSGVYALQSPGPELAVLLEGSRYPVCPAGQADCHLSLEEAVHIRATQLLKHTVYLSDGENSFAVAATKLGYEIDEDAVLARIKEKISLADHSSHSFRDRILSRLRSQNIELPIEMPLVLNLEQARVRLKALSRLVDRSAVDAELLVAEHRVSPSKSGRQLSIEASLVRLEHDIEPTDRTITLRVDALPPRITLEQLAPVDVTQVLASFETSFKGKAGPRATNIRAAGRYLDGAVLLPGETLSFNERVGRRVQGRGFVEAPVIINDELEQDVGGGVCQVATTLHAAAVLANLVVVNRRSHSRPSGYAPLGLDATVIDGKVDLTLRNPYDQPLLVHVSFPSDFKVRVELLGRAADVKVVHTFSVTHKEAFSRRIWHRAELAPGVVELKQKGSAGMSVVSVLQIKSNNGSVKTRRYHSQYYPVPEVFWVAEGTQQVALPTPAESVVQIVIDGEEHDAPLRGTSATETGDNTPPLQSAPNEVL